MTCVQAWHGGRIVLLWALTLFISALLVVVRERESDHARDIRRLLAHPLDDPLANVLGLGEGFRRDILRVAPAEAHLWFDSLPRLGTPERAALDSRKREVRRWLADRANRAEQVAAASGILVVGFLPVIVLAITWVWLGKRSTPSVDRRAAIQRWHFGKLLLLWLALGLSLVALLGAEASAVEALGYLAIPTVVVVAITWIWLGGRERSE